MDGWMTQVVLLSSVLNLDRQTWDGGNRGRCALLLASLIHTLVCFVTLSDHLCLVSTFPPLIINLSATCLCAALIQAAGLVKQSSHYTLEQIIYYISKHGSHLYINVMRRHKNVLCNYDSMIQVFLLSHILRLYHGVCVSVYVSVCVSVYKSRHSH